MSFLSPDSYWVQSAGKSPTNFPSLNSDCQVDVAVIGAGITGLAAALLLKHAGQTVAVLEAAQVGAGTTSGTSGHLDVAPDQGFIQLERDFGAGPAREITQTRARAIDQIESWVRQFGVACDFRRVTARAYTERPDCVERLQKEFDVAQRLGLSVAMKSAAELPFSTAAALEIGNQARIDALKFLQGLAQAVHGDGVAIYENTRAEPPEDGSPCEVQANGRRVVAGNVILATHGSYLGVSLFDVRQAAYQSYVLAVRVKEKLRDALYWDDEQPYHYLRLAASDDPQLLIVGGADHKTGQADARASLRQLEKYVAERFTVVDIEHQWSAEFFEPSDGLPFIGRAPATKHLFIATGFSGTGLTYGVAAAQILADLILGRSAPHAELFSPARFKPLAAAKDFIRENVNAAKHFVADRFAAERVESLNVVQPGEGRLLQLDGESYAVYRDEAGQIHVSSPVCTHAGCYVQWNNFEKTWDCPCHGGRYAPTGERIYGPPAANLEQKSAIEARSP